MASDAEVSNAQQKRGAEAAIKDQKQQNSSKWYEIHPDESNGQTGSHLQ